MPIVFVDVIHCLNYWPLSPFISLLSPFISIILLAKVEYLKKRTARMRKHIRTALSYFIFESKTMLLFSCPMGRILSPSIQQSNIFLVNITCLHSYFTYSFKVSQCNQFNLCIFECFDCYRETVCI